MLSHWTQDDIEINDVQLHYYRTGHGDKRSFVLVHGFSDSGLCWTPTARDLESEYDVIMPDMRGHGLSARVHPGENVDMAADVAELISRLELERPILGGHSMGAMISFQVGARFPNLISALILEDPPWWFSQSEHALNSDPAENPIAKWAKTLPSQTFEELLAQYRQDNPDWPEETVRLMVESKKQLDPAIIDMMVDVLRVLGPTWQTAIQRLVQPVLLIAANPELGGIVTPEVAATVRELNPNVTIVTIPDAGHLIRFDRYAAFMEALRAFLKQIPS